MNLEEMVNQPGVDAALWSYVRRHDLRCMIIFEGGLPYLGRFYVHRRTTPMEPARYLHYFFAADEGKLLHDHPWIWSRSVILSGGYVEERLLEHSRRLKWFGPGSMNVLDHGTFHRLDSVNPGTWSMFFAGPRVASWSFMDSETLEIEDWKLRNDRVKGDRAVEHMTGSDPRLESYRVTSTLTL